MNADELAIIRAFIPLNDKGRMKVLFSLYEDVHREEHIKTKHSPLGRIYATLNRLSTPQKKALIKRLEQGIEQELR